MVDLPAPDGPTMASVWPGGDRNDKPWRIFAIGIIAEAHILEPHFAARGCGAIAHPARRQFRQRVDQAEHRLHVDQPLTDGAIDHAEHVQWPEELGEQRVDQHDVASGELPLAPAPDGIAHRARHHQVGDQRLADVERGEAVLDFTAARA
jgi:hypothetical protein